MSTIHGVARFKIHPGKTEEFKRLAAECMQLAREKDSGTLRYEVFLNADETECVVYEEYKDSEALAQHSKNMGEAGKAIFETADVEGELLGDPAPDLAKSVQKQGVKLYSPFLKLEGGK